LGQGSQPQLIAQTPTQPKGEWKTDYVVHPGSKDGTIKLIYALPGSYGEGQQDVKNKLWPATMQDSATFSKGAIPSSHIINFNGQIVRRDAKGKEITIPFKRGMPVKLQPGDRIQHFVQNQPGAQNTNAKGQANPVDTFKSKLSNNALKRLQDNSNRLKSEFKDYQNLSPNNPKWQQLRKLAVKDQQLVQHSRRLDGQIAELIMKDRKENSFTSPNTFIDRDDVHPMGVVSPQIQTQIKQIESQQALLKIARRQMQAQYPALAVVDSAKVANSSNQELLGNINQGFGQIQGNISDLQKQIQADPSKALFLDDVVKGTLSGLKVDPNNPNQTKTGKEITNWLQGEQTKHNLIKWGGTLLAGGLTVGAIITTFATEGLALPFWLGLGGSITGFGTAAYEDKELATVDLAAQAQQGGGGNLTSQDKDTARFNLIMGRINLLMAGVDLGLSVKATRGLMLAARTERELAQTTKAISGLSLDAKEAIKALNLSADETLKIGSLIQKNPEITNDLLRQYFYKMRKADRQSAEFVRPKDIGKAIEQSIENYNIVKKRGYPFGFNSIQQYREFENSLKASLKKYNITAGDIRVHGSAVHKINPGDLDVAIIVDEAQFNTLGKRFYDGSSMNKIKKSILKDMEKGKISSQRFAPVMKPTVGQSVYGKAGDLDIQVSIIKSGSEFDVGPYLSFEK
jgi:hypothetical protein